MTEQTLTTTIKIGTQEWVAKNLDVVTFRNGDVIPEAKENTDWRRACILGKPAWCYNDMNHKHNRNPKNEKKYGKLYNWFAVNDPRGLAPQGYHIPSREEWESLVSYLGGKEIAGNKLKSTEYWLQEGNGTNESGFTAFPGGIREHPGQQSHCRNLGLSASFWSATGNDLNGAWYFELVFNNDYVSSHLNIKGVGMSIRCLKGEVSLQSISESISSKKVKKEKLTTTIKIGTQEWVTKNLDVVTFRNGDVIPEAKDNADWKKAGEEGKPAWCNYNNNPKNDKKFGKLYNWFAVNDPRGLAPQGYHIPSREECESLVSNLGGKEIGGRKLKSTESWQQEGNGTNESGFTALPGDGRDHFGDFNKSLGKSAYFWSSTGDDTFPKRASQFNMHGSMDDLFISGDHKGFGMSVRCLLD